MNFDPLIIALDVDSAADARSLVRSLGNEIGFYKVGMELYAAAGMDFVRQLLSEGKRVFLDMKYYDIGETVKRAVAQVAQTEVSLLTVHGSSDVMRAAIAGRANSPLKLLAVTVLTSYDQQDIADLGYTCSISDLVALRVKNAIAAEMDGIVASPLEAASIRKQTGPGMLIVTPGVRSAGASTGDQKRVATPADALRDGANYLVIGRQVTRAPSPADAVRALREEIAG